MSFTRLIPGGNMTSHPKSWWTLIPWPSKYCLFWNKGLCLCPCFFWNWPDCQGQVQAAIGTHYSSYPTPTSTLSLVLVTLRMLNVKIGNFKLCQQTSPLPPSPWTLLTLTALLLLHRGRAQSSSLCTQKQAFPSFSPWGSYSALIMCWETI